MKVAIFFLQRRIGGGTTTFTAHLFRALKAAGMEPMIYRLAKRKPKDLPFDAQFCAYPGTSCTFVTPIDALNIAKRTPSIISAAAWSDNIPAFTAECAMLRAGTRMVIHDPLMMEFIKLKMPAPIVIRKSMLMQIKRGVWIPHPYERQNIEKIKSRHAISIARVHNSKRCNLILQSNRVLPKRKRVELLGQEFRLYSYGLAKTYADVYKQSGKSLRYPLNFRAAVEECARSKYNVDLTRIKGDGGGTQYAQLEAMDGGCINIMHEDWFKQPGDLKIWKHVIPVAGAADLTRVLTEDDLKRNVDIQRNCEKLLDAHAPMKIGRMYKKLLGV